MSTYIFETALNKKESIKKLFKMAADFIQKGEIHHLNDIDAMLTDRFIEYLRSGTFDELTDFQYSVLSFIDSRIGDQLQESSEGQYYYHRWNHFHDLCETAVENYDPQLTKRFIESKKHGKELMELLYQNKEGLRHNQLAQQLNISPQNLSKLLREFAQHELIIRERKNKLSIITLSITGKAYIKEKKPETLKKPPYDTPHYPLPAKIASRKRDYMTIPSEFSRPLEYFLAS
jgi:DNA-binding MarR family transcriptional regulator